ncbi:MAG: DUF799 domain-containing protein [Woeseiaceae bacterium]|nr:DUF799 domain-containing protein [Woeseiaceae bacterium]
MTRSIIILLVLAVLSGCAQTTTKRGAYPLMYGDQKPVSMLVVPAINESTAANAGDLLNATISQPLSNLGYYVMPMPIVADIFQREGIIEGSQIKGLPTQMFKKNFGADSVLFMTITSWDKNYAVIAGNVTVGISYVLIGTETNDILWSYDQTVVVDTGGGSGNILAGIIATAIKTATTDYLPVAAQVHAQAFLAMPFGGYHPRSGTDGEEKSVVVALKDKALAE